MQKWSYGNNKESRIIVQNKYALYHTNLYDILAREITTVHCDY